MLVEIQHGKSLGVLENKHVRFSLHFCNLRVMFRMTDLCVWTQFHDVHRSKHAEGTATCGDRAMIYIILTLSPFGNTRNRNGGFAPG
jgi:hypothetical protein